MIRLALALMLASPVAVAAHDILSDKTIGKTGQPIIQGLLATDATPCTVEDACNRFVIRGVVESVDRAPGLMSPSAFRIREVSGGLSLINFSYEESTSRWTESWFDRWLDRGRKVVVFGRRTGQGQIASADMIFDPNFLAGSLALVPRK